MKNLKESLRNLLLFVILISIVIELSIVNYKYFISNIQPTNFEIFYLVALLGTFIISKK